MVNYFSNDASHFSEEMYALGRVATFAKGGLVCLLAAGAIAWGVHRYQGPEYSVGEDLSRIVNSDKVQGFADRMLRNF
jgi:hypothetical protein